MLRRYHIFSSDDAKMSCGNNLCTSENEAMRVCHHPECCQNATNGKSLLLCKECDNNIHSQPGFSGHLVLDLPPSARNDSGKKVPAKTDTEDASDLEEVSSEYNIQDEIQEEILEEDHVDGLKMVKSYSNVGNYGVEKRLKRKDAVKRKPSISNVKIGGFVSESISDSGDRTRSKSLSAMEIQMGAAQLQFPPSQFVERTIPEAGFRHLSLPGTSGNGFLQVFIESMDESIKIAALKGKSIQELLSPQLEHLNIDISLVNIYLESSNTPLPLNSDAGYLEGTNLFIKAKDGIPDISPTGLTAKEREKKVQSVLNAKTRRASNLSVDDSSVTVKGARPLFITNKQKDKEKLDTMLEVLKNAVTQQPPSTILELEPTWRDIVLNSSELPKEVQSQQDVIWELLYTETAYIESLKVITNLFMCCLQNVQDKLPAIMKEIECDKLFSNIVDVINANSILWKDYLSQMLQASRETKQPLNPSLMKEGFQKFPELFSPYQRFCAEQMICQNYIKEKLKSNDYFKNFVTWAEGNTELCRRLRLIDIIITPMQRLTRYTLLLRRIKEKSTMQEQKDDLQEMIETVEEFVRTVNLVVGERREQEKVVAMASRIDMYDAVEAPNDESVRYLQHYHGNFNLLSPMPGCGIDQKRMMVHRAILKYRDAATRVEVECYIFTDLFLICKSKKVNERLKVLRPPIRVNRVSVKELRDKGTILVIQLNEYDTPQMAFTLQADPSVIKAWIDKLHMAKEMYNYAVSIHRQQLPSESETPNEITETVSKFSPMQFPGRSDKVPDPYSSPKLHTKDRPVALSNFQKQKYRTITSEPSGSPMIVCQSPSPEHQSDSCTLPNADTKSSHSVGSNMTWSNYTINEEMKGKIDRSRKTEKRYFTADSIQEIKRQEQADNSIHKRLSWNLGSTKIDSRQNLLKQVSSDSIPSSSGVSSTGSTHLSPDHEGNENEDSTELDLQQPMAFVEPKASLTLNTENRSKSMSDIALLLQEVSPSEMKDGISSVDLPQEINYSGLTPTQILNIKKYLLLNTTNESEV